MKAGASSTDGTATLRQRIADAAAGARNLNDRRAIHQLWREREKLVEALRGGIALRGSHDEWRTAATALLGDLGEAK